MSPALSALICRFPQRRRDSIPRFRFVPIPSKKIFDLFFLHLRQQNARWQAARGIHAQVERDVVLPREAARGIVELHGGDAEIREENVGAGRAFVLEKPPESGVIAPHGPEGAGRAELPREGLEARRSLRQLDGVDVEGEKAAAGEHASQELLRVAPHPSVASTAKSPGRGARASRPRRRARARGCRRESFRRRSPFRALLGKALGLALLVLLLEPPRVRPAVTRAPLSRRPRGAFRHRGSARGLPTASGSVTPSQEPTVGARS